MGDDTKKIKFEFSKVKKPNLIKSVTQKTESEKVEFVDSFDGVKGEFSFRGAVRQNETVKEKLIIPMPGTRTAYDVIRSRVGIPDMVESEHEVIKNIGNENPNKSSPPSTTVSTGDKQQTLDELAAKEIIQNLETGVIEENGKNDLVISQGSDIKDVIEAKESTLEDYENIPVNDFGLAMLRGMGWQPEKGIGKEERIVKPVAQKLRPKGLGLGADKAVQKPVDKEADLKITRNSFVKFVSGSNKGKYGIIEGLDEDTGRAVVKLALGGVVSASEAVLVPVTQKDYEMNSKVLNSAQYEKYKEKVVKVEKKELKSKEKSAQEIRRRYSNSPDSDHKERMHRSRKSRSPYHRSNNSGTSNKERSKDKEVKTEDRSRNKGKQKNDRVSRRRYSSSSDDSQKNKSYRKSKVQREHSRRSSSYDSQSSTSHRDRRKHTKRSPSYSSDSSDSSSDRRRKSKKKSKSRDKYKHDRHSSSQGKSSRRHRSRSRCRDKKKTKKHKNKGNDSSSDSDDTHYSSKRKTKKFSKA